METCARPYLPGQAGPMPLPLARFFPPTPEGMLQRVAAEISRPGDWLLDPFGTSPAAALEAARSGRRVLVATNNPITSFTLDVLARAYPVSQFQAAFAELASVYRGTERLEVHLQSLYLTQCAQCEQTIPAEAFLWRRGETSPYARLYHCPHCGDNGERPVTLQDVQRLKDSSSSGLHRSRALERVTPHDDPARAVVEEALNLYTPRAVYFLFTVLNRIEGLSLAAEGKKLLYALLLSAFDAGNALWAWPAGRNRPRSLSIPPQYRENNLWTAMEEAIGEWAAPQGGPVPLEKWPAQPPASGGICLFTGRLKQLLAQPDLMPFSAGVATFPRPNQAFWTLSAVWSGWLWGRETAAALHGALERRRYDWSWHTQALYSTLQPLARHAAPGFSLGLVLAEAVPGFVTAALLAGQAAGFKLAGLALRDEESILQTWWQNEAAGPPPGGQDPQTAARESIRAYLVQRKESAPYLPLYLAALAGILLHSPPATETSGYNLPERYTQLQTELGRLIGDKRFLKHYDTGAHNPESGQFWLAGQEAIPGANLSDQVEMETVRFLARTPAAMREEIDNALCQLFPGLCTPSPDLILAILESYAGSDPQDDTLWALRNEESPATRRADLDAVEKALAQVGQRLGCVVHKREPILWQDANGQPRYAFFPFASAVISRHVYAARPLAARQCVLVFPGSRAKLLAFKLQRDLRLAEAASDGWRYLKFRHLRQLETVDDLNLETWDTLLDKDPPGLDEVVQMTMFDQ
ncbi:MAG: hypothetical protein VB089_21140 [Anaerolineaceae bacterium]|nr:hypothetical protein [Anaerolineaceae bacterium]